MINKYIINNLNDLSWKTDLKKTNLKIVRKRGVYFEPQTRTSEPEITVKIYNHFKLKLTTYKHIIQFNINFFKKLQSMNSIAETTVNQTIN